ncbi:hypothetical protein [Haloarchaeobius litoreus]|uniref:Uncharacterized protein n=1 Tax=Haloarchaeobius litoreus TaxID=755306 RepID=A0ABD6DE99_9EURY|nr:hypothetical protein [Haloarchaeobius litoreus]
MSESETESAEAEFDSKEAFFAAVRDGGAVLGELEYYTEGSGSATSYKARTDDGEVEDIKKSDVESAWEEHHDAEPNDESGEEDDGSEQVHLGTFYFSKANWDTDQDRETLEEMLEEAGWYIDSEVDSGGYRVKTERET